MQNITVIILAGGSGSRLRCPALYCPKPLLPVRDIPIFIRLITQCIQAGFSRFLISSPPGQSSTFSSLVKSFCPGGCGLVEIVAPEAPFAGPISALLGLSGGIRTSRCLLLLGDIVFARCPFDNFPLNGSGKFVFLGCAVPPTGSRLSSGVVVTSGCNTLLIERPRKPLSNGLMWSGMAFFNRKALLSAPNAAQWRSSDRPVGALLNSLRARFPLKPFEVPSFVNVNTIDDYRAALNLVDNATKS